MGPNSSIRGHQVRSANLARERKLAGKAEKTLVSK
jgi:hypothetical protein